MPAEAWLSTTNRLLAVAACTAIPSGIAAAILESKRSNQSTTQPTPQNTSAYTEHGQTLYCTPEIMGEIHAIHAVGIPATALMLILFGVRAFLMRKTARQKKEL